MRAVVSSRTTKLPWLMGEHGEMGNAKSCYRRSELLARS